MNGAAAAQRAASPHRGLGYAWLALATALAVHVADEALTGFLAVYNPTVVALRAKLGFFPMPVFGFRAWLTSLLLGIVGLALLSPLGFRNVRWARPLLYFVAVVLALLNAAGHIVGTVLGHTVASVRFARPAPGFWSSPLLIAAGIYALVQLRRTRSA